MIPVYAEHKQGAVAPVPEKEDVVNYSIGEALANGATLANGDPMVKIYSVPTGYGGGDGSGGSSGFWEGLIIGFIVGGS